MGKILESITKEEEVLARQTVILERLSNKMFPDYSNFSIFPIKTVDELEKIEGTLKDIPEQELIGYIKEIIGKAPLPKCFPQFFTNDVIIKINWDGAREKKAIKNFKLFNTFVFGKSWQFYIRKGINVCYNTFAEAVKNENFGYVQFEAEMKKGFKLAKNRVYKNTFKEKLQKKN